MKLSVIFPYFQNTFWLLIPILVFSIIFIEKLPPAYQVDVFWENIPAWVGIPENLLRILVFLLLLVMRLEISLQRQELGAWLYAVGTLLYFAAWSAQISFPESVWSSSMAGFMALAYTPIFWLAGLGLIGDSLTISRIPYKPSLYFYFIGIFLVFHNLHAHIAYVRQS